METKKWTDVKCFDSEMIFFGLDWGEITSYGHPTGKNLFKVNNRSARTRCGICSKLTIKTPERRWRYISLYNRKNNKSKNIHTIREKKI